MTDQPVNEHVDSESQIKEVPTTSWSSYLFSKANGVYEAATGASQSVDWQELQTQASSTATLIGETGMTGLGVISDKIDEIVQTETYNKVDEWAYQNRREIVVGALMVGTAVVMPGVALAVAKPLVVGAMGNSLSKILAARQRPLDMPLEEGKDGDLQHSKL